MAILLLDLPPEVLHLILFHSAVIRRVRRALRLRLVCKTFDAALPAALFETRLMDDYPGIGTMQWRLGAQYADSMWHEYLVVRIMTETDPAVGRFCEVRQVAELARQEMMRSGDAPVPALRELVEQLCWLLLRQAVRGNGSSDIHSCWTYWGPSGPMVAFPPDMPRVPLNLFSAADWDPSGPRAAFPLDMPLLPLNLLSAAAYFNLPALAQRLLDEGHNPNHHTFLFAPAMQTAAQAGHGAMLERLRRPGCPNDLTALQAACGETAYEPKDNWAIIGATIRGDLDFLREVLAHEVPSALPRPLSPLVGPRCLARTRDVYDCLGAAVCPGPGPALAPWQWELEHHARHGHLDMVEYLLDLGLPLGAGADGNPLFAACRGGHWDVVKFLLARGGPPNKTFLYINQPQHAIHAPAVASSVSAARLLLDHGADPNIGEASQARAVWPYPLIWYAFERENMALVHLLVERGVQVNESLRLSIAGVLHHLEYESMEEEFHRLFGFKLDPGAPYPPARKRWRGWHQWRDAVEKRNRIHAQAHTNENSVG